MKIINALLVIQGFLLNGFAYASNIEVKVDNLTAKKGKVYASLCQKASFMNGRCDFEIVRKVEKNQQQLIFNEVSPGSYAISIFYDVNDNGELDTSLFGIPKEPTGVSNNAIGKNGPPAFDKASFVVNENATVKLKISVF